MATNSPTGASHTSLDNQRPDPDALLAQMQSQTQQASRGRLRIYFGANAGVGKTYAMLAAARQALKDGRDVLVGIVETHKRADTAALLEGLPVLPLRPVAYRGNTLHEFDLDAALARKPAVLLVDELAHSNAPGSRHAKRWQDVQELCDAGIEVWSALNVQHLESLNGTVGAITGIRVHETVPDTVIDSADELVVIDVTPDEMLGRLKAGKVYLPQQAERAAQNFFRKGNLIALREIALRRTAEHVEDDVRSYRIEKSIAPSWNTEGAILACVGPHAGSEQTVRTAARLAGQLNVRWYAAYVETPRLQRLPVARRDTILAVLKLADSLGAETAVLAGSSVAPEIITQAQRLNCATLVVGWGGGSSSQGLGAFSAWSVRAIQGVFAQPVVQQLAALAPTLDIVQTGKAESTRPLRPAGSAAQSGDRADSSPPASPHAGHAAPWQRYGGAVAASFVVTVLALPLATRLDLANIVMLFLLATVLVALKLGRGPSALTAVLSVLAFDFFFVPPRMSFAVSDVQYLITFAVMLAIGLLTGQLTAGLRFQADIAASRERRAQSLFELTRDLSSALQASQVLEWGTAAVKRNFGGDALVLALDDQDRLQLPDSEHPAPPGFDATVADWVLRNGQPAGLATATLSAQSWHYLPLAAPMRLRGVLALRPRQPHWLLIPEQVQQLDTLARQIAIALERVHYVEVAQAAVVQMESSKLRNMLLAAISHDVRTPLAALIGLADTLGRSTPPLATGQMQSVAAIADVAHQLSALVGNLLDMARLQSGTVRLKSDWQSVEEIVGSAIRQAQHALGTVKVSTAIAADLPLVEFDAVLIERVLVNLLENAAKYGNPARAVGSSSAAAPGRILVSAEAPAGALLLRVRDYGPGLPQALLGSGAATATQGAVPPQPLFDMFTRGEAESATPGVGLGLAICKAVVEAHQGTISARNIPADHNGNPGGAEFTLQLPRREMREVREVQEAQAVSTSANTPSAADKAL